MPVRWNGITITANPKKRIQARTKEKWFRRRSFSDCLLNSIPNGINEIHGFQTVFSDNLIENRIHNRELKARHFHFDLSRFFQIKSFKHFFHVGDFFGLFENKYLQNGLLMLSLSDLPSDNIR